MRVFAIILIVLIALGVGAYFYWINSPLFAFQEAALAIKNHDEAALDRRVATANLVDQFLDDLVVQPALSTPNLSEFQMSVASGALTMAKEQMTNGLMESIHKSLATNDSGDYPPTALIILPNFNCLTTQPALAASNNSASLKDLMHAASHEMSAEVKKQKTEAFNRMLTYIQNHPTTVPGRLLNCPHGERSAHVRLMLDQYGLNAKNFKGLAGCSTSSDIIGRESGLVGFNFFSPQINQEITIQIELLKDKTSGDWRINRLANIAAVMDQLEPTYQRDIHELVEYSLSGMNNKNLTNDMRGMTDRLKKDPSAQNLLNKLNLHF